MSGRFIVFEGGDGSGKSTAARSLRDELVAAGQDVVLTREPGGTPKAEEIRRLILERKPEDRFHKDTQTLLFYAARIEHVQDLIIPALQAGKVVICDRFEMSTYMYQITAGAATLGILQDLHRHIYDMLHKAGVPTPEYIIMVLEPEIGLKRVQLAKEASGDTTPDVFDDEDIAFHRRLQEGIHAGLDELKVDDRHRYLIDASQAPEAVLADIKQQLRL